MRNLDDGSFDPNIKFLKDLVSSGRNVNIVRGSEFGKSQTYIIQWENIIQHFNAGKLAIIGTCAKYGLSQACAELDSEIMLKINSDNILYNRPPHTSIYKFIADLHVSKYGEESKERWYDILKIVERDVNQTIEDDEYGLIFQVSPFLTPLNAIRNARTDGTVDKAIFVLNKKYCEKCHDTPFKTLMSFFEENREKPVYIDITDKPFNDYMNDYIAERKRVDNHVIVTDNRKFIWDTISNPKINGMSILMPYIPRKNLTDELAGMAGKAKLSNEYIVYTSKPLSL